MTEDLRRIPEKQRNDLTAIRRLATAQGNTYRAQLQVAENTKAHTRAKLRTQTLYVAPDPPRSPRPDRAVPHLPGHERIGFFFGPTERRSGTGRTYCGWTRIDTVPRKPWKFRNDDTDDDGLTRGRSERGSRFERDVGPTGY